MRSAVLLSGRTESFFSDLAADVHVEASQTLGGPSSSEQLISGLIVSWTPRLCETASKACLQHREIDSWKRVWSRHRCPRHLYMGMRATAFSREARG